MSELETRLRRGFDRYAQATPVVRPPLDELLDHPVLVPRLPERPRYVLTAVGIAAVATAVVGAVVWPDQGQDDDDTVSTSDASCVPHDAPDGTVGQGQLRDGRTWVTEISGQPPTVVESTLVDGQRISGSESHQAYWAGVVNQGNLFADFEFYDQGLLVSGKVPTNTATVELQVDGGEPLIMCPVSVPGIDQIDYFAGYLPAQPRVTGLVALDAAGRRVAYLDRPQRLYDVPSAMAQPGEGLSSSIDLAIDPARVDLPLGGEAWPDIGPDDLSDVITGQLPSGPWAVRAGRDDVNESLIGLELELPGGNGFPRVTGTAEELLATPRWGVGAIDDRLFVSGWTPADVATVVVTLGDGQTVEIAVVDSGVPGFEAELFASALPEGATIAAMDGRASDGRVVVAVDIGEPVGPRDEIQSVAYPVHPVP